MAKHAKLSPSAGHRWVKCSGSVKLIRDTNSKSTGSFYANEGTAAHALMAKCLNYNRNPNEFLNWEAATIAQDQKEAELLKGIVISEEMVENVNATLEYIGSNVDMKVRHTSFVEVALPLFYSPSEHGTADFVYYDPNSKLLHVFDLKYGAGVYVEVKNNEQLQIYSISALDDYKGLYDIEGVVTHIIQPRMNNLDFETYTLKDLDMIRIKIGYAVKSIENNTFDLVPGEKQCRFCPAKGACPAIANEMFDVVPVKENKLPNADVLTDDQISLIIDKKREIVNWLNAVEEYAKKIIEDGGELKGYHLKPKRPQKVWEDENKAYSVLSKILPDEVLKKDVLLSPSQALKMIIKYEKNDFTDVVNSLIVKKVNGFNVTKDESAEDMFD